MPPDPVAWLDRSRGQAPYVLMSFPPGTRSLLARCRALRRSDAYAWQGNPGAESPAPVWSGSIGTAERAPAREQDAGAWRRGEEPDRESGHARRRGPGASEERSAR